MSVFNILILIGFILINLFLNLTYFYKIFKNYQLNGYYFLKSLKSFKFGYLELSLLILILVYNLIFSFINNKILMYVLLIIFFVLSFILILKFKQKNIKNKLIFTKRFTRFFLLFAIIFLVFTSLCVFLFYKNSLFPFIFVNSLFLSFFICLISHLLILPFEVLVKKFYIFKAKRKLKIMKNLKIVAITGSFGKTSVKNFLYNLLKSKYKVCVTEGSFNTEMGITKTILNKLKLTDEILILEMGADRLHDINKLCKIVKPDYSIITGVNNQHLNTFKTKENIIKTKYELIENTKEKGVVVLNGENKITRSYYYKTKLKKYMVGKNTDYFASNIKTSFNGTSFILNKKNKQIKIKTELLGKHNVLNLLISFKMAEILGVNLNKIIKNVKDIKRVAHRLNLIKNNGRFILDDTFNANPNGVKNAINVLKTFNGKKIVITSGLVELGKDSFKENYKLGKLLRSVDIVIITNNINKKALLSGLGEKANVYFEENLNDALITLNKFFNVNDCVLFLNDLPDCYN